MFTGIHHTSFTVSDMDRSIAFFRDILGMELTWDSKAAGVEFKGPVADAVTGCPGTKAANRLPHSRRRPPGARGIYTHEQTPDGQ